MGKDQWSPHYGCWISLYTLNTRSMYCNCSMVYCAAAAVYSRVVSDTGSAVGYYRTAASKMLEMNYNLVGSDAKKCHVCKA